MTEEKTIGKKKKQKEPKKAKIKKEKTKKEKKEFSTASNILYSIKTVFKCSPSFLFIGIFLMAASLASSVYFTYESKLLIDTLDSGSMISGIVLSIAGIIGVGFSISFIRTIFNSIYYYFFNTCYLKIHRMTYDTLCAADYDKLESPEYKNLYTQYSSYKPSVSELIHSFFEFLKTILSIIIFGTMVSTLHPLIVLGIAVLAVIHFLVQRSLTNVQHKLNIEMVANDRKFGYVTKISGDFENAKEVRVYNMSNWISYIAEKCVKEHRRLHSIVQWRAFRVGTIHNVLSLLRDGFAYVYLIFLLSKGEVTPGNFVLFFTAITNLSTTMTGISEKLNNLRQHSLKISDARKLDKAISSRNRGTGIPIPRENLEIEFKNVSFRYPGAEADTIKNISFKIKSGERVALVGVNGAGKTTIVKLLCGLYLPTQGEILLNSRPIKDYNIYDYYSLFSAVFQDISVLPYSIAENVAVTTDKNSIDYDRVSESISKAGLSEKISSLEKGVDSLFDKEINEGAIDFSGGEKQKLALARAIYLCRPVLVLDEPTSALDPIAENNMYIRFNDISENTASLFISHRLASTRFCDRIIHLENGIIIEDGTHDSLMAAKGKYAEMYDIQSQYYKDGEEKQDA